MLGQKNLKWATLIAVMLTSLLMSKSASADEKMERAMKAVFGKKQVKKLKIKGHEFNVKPAKFQTSGKKFIIKGQISHRLRWRDDDQVYYTIEMDMSGRITDLQIKVKKSKVQSVLKAGWKVVKEILRKKAEEKWGNTSQKLSFSDELKAREEAIKLAEKKIGTGGWEKAAACIIANVMVRAKPTSRARAYDRVRFLRKLNKARVNLKRRGRVSRNK